MLNFLFNVKSVAVIGASQDPMKIGHAIMENVLGTGFSGKIYPINPANKEIMGLRCYMNVTEVKDSIDLVVIALPASRSVEALSQCVAARVKCVIIVAGGFSELGGEGRALQDQINEMIKGTQTRVIGPNTVGVLFPYSNLNTALTPKERIYYPGRGEIAFISQSGALGLLTMDSITEYDLGISGFVNIGNRTDIDESDLLQAFSEDIHTKSIAVYLESVSDGNKFYETVKRVNLKKPVVVLKTGRSEASSRAASFHTGALASDDRVIDGILKQAGVQRALDEVDLIDYGKALAYGKPLKGKRIAIITTAGGAGVVTTDLLTSNEYGPALDLTKFNDTETAEMKKAVLPFASVANPIDLTADGNVDTYEIILDVISKSGNVDGIIAYALPQTPKIDLGIVDVLSKYARNKPMVVGVIGNRLAKDVLRELEKKRIPAYPSISRSVKAMKVLYNYGHFLNRRGVP